MVGVLAHWQPFKLAIPRLPHILGRVISILAPNQRNGHWIDHPAQTLRIS